MVRTRTENHLLYFEATCSEAKRNAWRYVLPEIIPKIAQTYSVMFAIISTVRKLDTYALSTATEITTTLDDFERPIAQNTIVRSIKKIRTNINGRNVASLCILRLLRRIACGTARFSLISLYLTAERSLIFQWRDCDATILISNWYVCVHTGLASADVRSIGWARISGTDISLLHGCATRTDERFSL